MLFNHQRNIARYARESSYRLILIKKFGFYLQTKNAVMD